MTKFKLMVIIIYIAYKSHDFIHLPFYMAVLYKRHKHRLYCYVIVLFPDMTITQRGLACWLWEHDFCVSIYMQCVDK